MKNIWKLFVGDVRRLTSNIVSIIIVIGLVVIPGLFSWFNVSASWDPFANTGNLKFAVANDDEGYKSDLIPVKISIGDQVVNTLRANDQMDWTFTTKKEAIDGTKSGKYYAAVVIPKDFSTRMIQQREEERTRSEDHRPGSRHRGSTDQRNVLRNVDEHRAQHRLAAGR